MVVHAASTSLPLFPLHSALVPGGLMALRIFEPRYLDLVRSSCREGSSFGICSILDGDEVGAAAAPAAVGCEARIVDFASLPDGLLGITVQGGRRFHVQRTRVRDNGLVVADIEWLPETTDAPLAIEHELMATLLQRLLEQIGGEHAKATPGKFRDADWVSWRLAELLPLSAEQRQSILQEDDPQLRLQQIQDLIVALQTD